MTELRRATDNLGHTQKVRIMELIEQENDSEKRTLLLILNSINENLQENTKYTQAVAAQLTKHIDDFQAHRDEFDTHRNEEMAAMNQNKGVYRVLKWLTPIVQAAILSVCAFFWHDLQDIHKALETDKIEHQQFKDAQAIKSKE